MILDALEYIQAYPETFHHPLEDKAFSYLESHGIGDAAVINEIKQQHGDLEKLTAHLSAQFNVIAHDCIVPFESLKNDCRQFIEAQRHHLKTENQKIFPTLATLSNEAWWDIATRLIVNQDPLFRDDPNREKFKNLAEEIIEEAASI